MKIDDEAVHEFIRLYEKEFEEALTPEQGREMASRVLELYRALAQPLPSERKKDSRN